MFFKEKTNIIPNNIIQILIADRKVDDAEFLIPLENNIDALKSTYPDATHHIYRNDEIETIIAENFPKEVIDAYCALQPYAFKADLARYCLLFKFGGLYSDLSYLHVAQISTEANKNLVVFRDIPNHPSWAVSNGVIFSRPEHDVLERAINKIVTFHKNGFTGIHALEVSGPYMFGRILAETIEWNDIVFGDSKFLNRDEDRRSNIIKMLPSGKLVAIRNKTRNGSIKGLVGAGGNNYVRMWKSGNIWGQNKAPTFVKRMSKLIFKN